MPKSKPKAEDAYVEAHYKANDLLDQIREQLFDMPAPEGDETIHWGHVGDVAHVNELLSQVVVFLANED